MTVGIGNTPFGADHILTDEEFERLKNMSPEMRNIFLMSRINLERQAVDWSSERSGYSRSPMDNARNIPDNPMAHCKISNITLLDNWHTENNYAFITYE